MAEITAADVKALRDATGAGMMDAKKALVAAEGDPTQAARILREKGLTKVATLEDRENNQGAVSIARAGNTAALVELRSETDFAAKSDDFVALVERLAQAVLADGVDAAARLSDDIDTVKIAKKENIVLGRVERFEAADGNVLDTYLHEQDGRGTVGVLVELHGDVSPELAHEVALHTAFAKPQGLSRDEIDPALVETAREGFESLTRKEGKPEQAVPKIVEGRLNAGSPSASFPNRGCSATRRRSSSASATRRSFASPSR
ncbi:MAG: translation elongation factor Ts [Microthrixaceae bacterium]